jgi:hypothetical protein
VQDCIVRLGTIVAADINENQIWFLINGAGSSVFDLGNESTSMSFVLVIVEVTVRQAADHVNRVSKESKLISKRLAIAIIGLWRTLPSGNGGAKRHDTQGSFPSLSRTNTVAHIGDSSIVRVILVREGDSGCTVKKVTL